LPVAKARKKVAAAIVPDAADTRHPHRGPLPQPLALDGQQGRVCAHNDDDGDNRIGTVLAGQRRVTGGDELANWHVSTHSSSRLP